MSHNILFSLYSWKRGNKSFELIIQLETKPFAGLQDYYTIYFVQNKVGPTGLMFRKKISKFSYQRFTLYPYNKDYRAFKNTLYQGGCSAILDNGYIVNAIKLVDNFHCSKINILGLKVLDVV